MPKFETYNNKVFICSHAFINTIDFCENERIRTDFVAALINRFKDREKITNDKFDENIIKYYKSYEDVLKGSNSKLLDTIDDNVIENDKGEEKLLEFKWITPEELKSTDLRPNNIRELLVNGKYVEGLTHIIKKEE